MFSILLDKSRDVIAVSLCVDSNLLTFEVCGLDCRGPAHKWKALMWRIGEHASMSLDGGAACVQTWGSWLQEEGREVAKDMQIFWAKLFWATNRQRHPMDGNKEQQGA